MKLHHATIQNFKRIAGPLELDFRSSPSARPRPLTCLIGDNGSGKTTVLQAIALVLSLATRRTRFANEFNWHGYIPQRMSSRGSTRIELQIGLDEDEVRLTSELFREWYDSQSSEWRQSRRVVPPSEHRDVSLIFEDGRLSSNHGFEGVLQFLGRYYIKSLVKLRPDARSCFNRIGDVFWFDQYRNLGSMSADRGDGDFDPSRRTGGWQAGVNVLREFLVGMWGYHKSPQRDPERDYIALLEPRFAELFPGTRFQGLEPRDDSEATSQHDFFFLLEREGCAYDLAEMSSGEQAVFPLLYEFVRLSIAKSIVLIDELELHLHPPEQQALLAMLAKLGPDCQYLVTTHSKYLTDVMPEEHLVRMEGGRRCL